MSSREASTEWSQNLLDLTGPFMVETKNVSKVYTMGRGETKVDITALEDVTLKIEKGTFVVLVGPSGSGKTTLLNLIGGLDKPSTGNIKISSLDITRADRFFMNLIREETIGYIHQTYNLISLLSALENVELPMDMVGIDAKDRRKRAIDVLKKVGLENRMDHKPYELSGGEQQRVGIARALVFDPPLILADEPTANLDTKIGLEIINLMRDLNEREGTTFIVSTHDLKITEVADLVIYLRDGKIVGEDVVKKDVNLAKQLVLKPEIQLSQDILDIIFNEVRIHLIDLTITEGEQRNIMGMNFELRETIPHGQVKITRETQIKFEA